MSSSSKEPGVEEARIIKKYPNRRLYDTERSSYITLEDVRQLVVNNIPIKVIDARSEEDLTHTTLLQIIMESEEKGPSLFSTDSLQKMIRFYGGSMQDMQQMLRTMLEQSMSFLGDTQKQGMVPPLQSSLEQWQSMQQQWMNTWVKQMQPKWPMTGNAEKDQEKETKSHNPNYREPSR